MTELPTAFGKYFLTEKLATGGMAEIYLAKLMGPGGFEKQLVIKQIHPKLSGQRHFVDLFVNEAKTLVTLTHGNIVPVYELGVIDDTYFIAMEYIDGPTLYRLTETLARKQTRMDPALAAWITARILEGLDYAHRKGEGVIHRDLSPRNVMLSRDGDVKLVDFGIAVTLGEADDNAAQSAPTGSFPYMSPEQVRREALTGQTDLFSAGVLLWEMLTGRRLFAKSDADATLAAVTSGDIPRPSSIHDDIPARLDEVVMRALERDRDARWPSAGEMLAQLQRYLYSLDETPGPREVAALVAKWCPPETRRQPTHADPLPHGEGTEVTPPPAGPRTAVIPRDAPEPKKKGRARTETFATNVELKHMLERSTPLFPIPAITDEQRPPPDDDHDNMMATKVSSPAIPAIRDAEPSPRASQRMPRADRSHDGLPDAGQPPRTPPLLVAAAIGVLLLGALAIVMFLKSRGGEPGLRDAAVASIAAPTPDGAPADAAPDDATTLDASTLDAMTLDAVAVHAADAGPHVRFDAGPATPSDAAPRATGTAVLKVGADPWGDVFIDGTKRGRTPFEITISAGKHSIEVVFGGEDPPRVEKRTVDLAPGETKQIDVKF